MNDSIDNFLSFMGRFIYSYFIFGVFFALYIQLAGYYEAHRLPHNFREWGTVVGLSAATVFWLKAKFSTFK